MFGIGGVELAIILVFAFLLFGPDKLPQIIRTVTQILNQLKGLRDQANQVIKTEVVDPLKDIEKSVSPLTNNATAVSDKLAQKLGIASNTISEALKPVGDELKAAAATNVAAEKGTIPVEKKPSHVPSATAAATTATTATKAAVDAAPQESFAQRKARLEREQTRAGLSNQGNSPKPDSSPNQGSSSSPKSASPSQPENSMEED